MNNQKYIPDYLQEIVGSLKRLERAFKEVEKAITEFKKEKEYADNQSPAEEAKEQPKERKRGRKGAATAALQHSEMEEG